jgi:hypothetical protein
MVVNMIDRLLQLKTTVTEVTNEMEWNSFSNSDWKTLENVKTLQGPFAEYTQLLTETH